MRIYQSTEYTRFLNVSGLHKVLNKIFRDRCLAVFWICFGFWILTSQRRFNKNSLTWWYVLKTSWRYLCKRSWKHHQDVLKRSWRRFCKTSWRHFKDVSTRRLENVLKMCSRHMAETNILVLTKTYWRRLEDAFWRRMFKANISVFMKMCWRRLL